jgi:hypothetical protein
MSNRGIVVLAQNSQEVNYVEQACLLALSLQYTNPNSKISVITNDEVPNEYKPLFDSIIPIPWTDNAVDSDWKIENRWKIYHASPYDETIVLDTDMLILQDISTWWEFLSNYDLYFTSQVYTYRGNVVTGDYYRKTFTSNHLPNIYSGLHYFKKCDFSHEFYNHLELVVNNWQRFYEVFLKADSRPDFCSIDVCAAIVTLILDCEDQITNKISKFPTFTHMKPHIQDWIVVKPRWQDSVDVYFSSNGTLKLGNHNQTGILHYTEDDFIKPYMFSIYKDLLNV